MHYYPTRYAAKKANPNAVIRKVLNLHVNAQAGSYVAFHDLITYETWKRCGHVR